MNRNCNPEREQAYLTHARRMLLLDVLANGTATLDDVWSVAPPPKGIGLRRAGEVPVALRRLGIIRAVARVRSVRPGRHSLVSIWVLVNLAAAERWLREHPDGEHQGI
jgi:hypothetical protein